MNSGTIFGRHVGTLSACVCATLVGFGTAASTHAAGITQPTFLSTEVGKIIYTFPQATVGDRVTIGDFQHGQLYLASGSFGVLVRDTWWSMTNMASTKQPVLLRQLNTNHDKPHNICFWNNFFNEAPNGSVLRIWNYQTGAEVGTKAGTVSSLWDFIQAPYAYTGSHGYNSGSLIEIWDISNPASIQSLGSKDTSIELGFAVGSVHAFGNLLVCSATETFGVAVYDISDPANPILLDSRRDGTSANYTSLIYGSRVFNCERTDIRVYDFSNPRQIQHLGTIPVGNTPRYVIFKDGKGYCATGSQNIKVFDTTTLNVVTNYIPDGKIMDFVCPVGNMMIVGGGGAGGNSTNGARIMALQTNPDTLGPSVVYTVPPDGSTDVGLKSRVGLSMSDQIDVESLTTNNFIVRVVGSSNALAGTYSTMMGLVNFSPSAPLSPNTTHEVILIAGGVKDTVGNGIAAQFRSTFTTTGGLQGGAAGLTHRWMFDGDVIDSVGANNGANTGVTFTNGMVNQAGVFDGADFVNLGSLDLSNAFTIAAWVWIDSTATNIQTIMANAGGGNSTAGFRFFVNNFNTANRAVVFETGNGTAGNSASTAANAINFGVWNHIAVTVDRSGGLASIYINGSNMTSDSSVLNNFTVAATTHFGQFTDNGSRLHGRLDEVRTYSRVLTASEVADLVSLSHYWPLDGNFTDFAGSNNGANTGAVFTNAARVGTQSSYFDGADFVNMGAVNLGNAFTISAWVWPDIGSTNIQTLLANASGGSTSNGFRLFYNSYNTADGALIFETGNGSAGDNARTSGGLIVTGAWNHVAVSVNRTSGSATLYVNGVNATTDSTILNNFGNTAALYFGQMANNSFRLHGRLDDVRLYSKAMSAAEIANVISIAGNSLPVITSLTSSVNPLLVNGSMTATLSATDGNGDALSYSFDFGDGGGFSAYSTSRTASHTYTAAGRYTLKGRARDASGNFAQTSIVQVVNRPLTATNAVASSQIVYDASRGKVWNVNPDSDTVTRIDATGLTNDFERAVGTRPRTLALRPNNAEVWVACEGSDDLYVLSATNGTVLQRLSTPRGSRPMGIAFAPNGTAAYVTYMNSGLLAKWDPATRTQVAVTNVGSTPRPIAISGDSSRIFVGRFISPVNPFAVTNEVGEVREVSAATFGVVRTFQLAHETGVDSDSFARGTPNYLLQMAISPDGVRLFVPSKKDNVDRGTFRDGQPLTHDTTVRAIFSKLDLVNNVEATGERVDVDNHSLPHGVAFSPIGDLAFIAFQGNNEIQAFNAYDGTLVGGILLSNELAPQGLVITPNGSRLFVLNFMTRSVSAYDVSAFVAGTATTANWLKTIDVVATEKLSAQVLQGKQIFYNAADTRMSGEGYISCASCHLDGGSDQRVWDFTDRGEGFRNTITLEGRRGMGQGNVHWTANFDEVQDFELDIRNNFGGSGFITGGSPNPSLGASNAGRSTELDAMAAYVSSLSRFRRSPLRNSDGTLTADAVAGRQIFVQQNCVSCHSGAEFSDSIVSTNAVLHDVGTIKASSGKRLSGPLTGLDTPTLKGLWNTAPLLHDGSAATLLDVITSQNSSNQHGVTTTLTATQQQQLAAYLQQIDDLEIGGQTHLWPFDGNVLDVIGTNNGINNSVTFTNGMVATAGVFDGADFVNVGAINLGNAFTLATWAWVDPAFGNIQGIMANSAGGFNAPGFRWYVNSFNTTNRAVVLETGDGTNGVSAATASNAITLGAWNHLTVVVDLTAAQATIYVNGTNKTSTSGVVTAMNVNATLHIGQFTNNVFRNHGRMDEVAVFNRALSATEVNLLANGDAVELANLSSGGLFAFRVGGGTTSGGSTVSGSGPQIRAFFSRGSVVLTWPAGSTSYVLEARDSIDGGGSWSAVNAAVVTEDAVNRVTLPVSALHQYFRLRQQ